MMGIDTGLSSICYFSSSKMVLGHHFLIKKFLKSNYSVNFLAFFIKQIFSINRAFNINIIKQQNYYRFKKIYITWGFKKDFDKKGNIKDQYFKISSNNKSILWIVLYIDKNIPKKISSNVILVSNLHNSKKNNILMSLFYLAKTIFNKKFIFNKIYHQISYTSLLAENIFKKISKNIDFKYVEKVFTPYEGQPFQHYIPQKIRDYNKKVKFYGYVSHNLPHSFDMIHRDGSPDILFLQSEDQKKYFIKNLGWNKSKVRLINSLRFDKTSKQKLSNKIFFSNQLTNIEKMSKYFEKYLKSCKQSSLNNFTINLHPRGYSQIAQKKLKEKLEKIIKEQNDKFSTNIKSNISIVIGLTATPIYLLEHKIKVIHIVENEFFHSYNKKYWPSLISKKINECVYEYILPKGKKVLNLSTIKSLNPLKRMILN